MNHSPSDLDDRISTRGFFERILKEFKETLQTREDLLDERFSSQKEAITKAEGRMDNILAGFPQEYAKRLEIEQMKATADTTAATLRQQVLDSAKALAEASDKTEGRLNDRIKKIEDSMARLGGVALIAPVIMSTITALLILQFN